MISAQFLAQLCCPESHQMLRLASESEVDALNQKIGAGLIKNKAGRVLEKKIDGALVREDGEMAYLILDNLPILLVDESISI